MIFADRSPLWARTLFAALLATSMLVFWWSRTMPERLAFGFRGTEWIDARQVPAGGAGYWSVQNPNRNLAVIGAALLGYASAFPVLVTWDRRRRVAGCPRPGRRSQRFVLSTWCVGIGLAAGSVLSAAENLGGPRLPTGVSPRPPALTATDALLWGLCFAGALYFACTAILGPLASVGRGLLLGPRLRREAEVRRLARRAKREARVLACDLSTTPGSG